MSYIVTGGAGFIGSHLADALIEAGHTVHVVDDLSTGRLGRTHPMAPFHRLDVTDLPALQSLVVRTYPDVIFHLAAQVNVRSSVSDPLRDAQTNILGTVNVLTAAATVGAKVLFTSSGGALYGGDRPLPAVVGDPCWPESPYGASKLAAEHYVRLYGQLDKLPHSILRLANVYGPRQDTQGEGGVIAIFSGAVVNGDTLTIFGDGKQTRDFVYVGDVVRAFIAAAAHDGNGTWNIGTADETSINDLAAMFPSPVQYEAARAGEITRSVVGISATTNDIGWKPKTSLGVGINKTLEWIRSNEPVRGEA